MSGQATVSIIAAVAANGVIGDEGSMPWHLSTDMKRFRGLTMGKPVVMGRKTFESIGKPLAGRLNIVITRQPNFRPQGATAVGSLEEGLAFAEDNGGAETGEVIIAGGGEVYAAAIERADRLYITHVEASPAGDVHFPPIDATRWRAVSREAVPAGEKDSAATTFVVYERIPR